MVELKKDVIKMNTDVLSDLIIDKIYSVSTIYTEESNGAKRKNRQRWALVIKYEGETCYVSNGKKYVSNINNIALLPKGCDYDWICKKSGHFSIVEFECEKTYHDIFSFNVKNGEQYHRIIKKMEINRTLKKTAYILDELKDLYGLISSLLKNDAIKYMPSTQKQKILPAIEYIAQNYNKRIYNDELSSVTGLSTVYFRKLFKDVMGISPISYIQSVKMGKAKKMLNSDYSSITDIAYSLGYNNVYEFSRDFKKYTGISPSKYVRQHL